MIENIKAALLGVAVGDALGVPVEFKSRIALSNNSLTDMIGFGTHDQKPGTWSDDSSLTFCLAEALTEEFDLQNLGRKFVQWYYEKYWTPRGRVFDIGIATREAIFRLEAGVTPEFAGGTDEDSNGNGSLMRILPLLFYIHQKPVEERYFWTKQASSLTHGHIRSVVSCFYYLEFARHLLLKKEPIEIYHQLQVDIPRFLRTISIADNEMTHFDRLFHSNIYEFQESEIESSGYVLHTLEASIWSLMTTSNYTEAVLKAINLGKDTDTTGAVTGGLAGIYYGFEGIPTHWINSLARKDDILDLAQRMSLK